MGFGIGLTAALGDILATTLGVDAAIGLGIAGGLEGAGLGAAGSAIMGGNPLTGAITGGLSGGALAGLGGAGGVLDSATGLGAVGSDALIGAGSGALGSAITGSDPLTGALTGGAGGALAGLGGEVFGGGGSGVGELPSTPSPFGSAASDASNALTYSPSVAPGVAGGADFAASPLTLGVPTTIGGPTTAAFAPPSTSAGSIDLTSNFGAGPGGDVFSGASTAETVPTPGGGAPSTFGADTGATFSDSLTPATTGTPGGPVEGGNFDVNTGGSKGFFGSIGDAASGVGKFLSSPTGKLIGTGVSALGLGNSLLSAMNPNAIPGQAEIEKLARELGSTGTGLIGPNAASAGGVADAAHQQAGVLENYLNTGTLPPQVQTALDSATNNAIIAIKAQYASRGMPPNSSSEIQDINAIRQNAVIQGGTLAASLYSQGVSQDQLASSIYQNLVGSGTSLAGAGIQAQTGLVQQRTATNNGLNASIANLATSLGGGRINNSNTVQAQAA